MTIFLILELIAAVVFAYEVENAPVWNESAL